jgi:hypothetical protein
VKATEAVKILEAQPRGTLLVSSWHSIGSLRPSHFSTEAGTPPPSVPPSTCTYAPHHALPQQLTTTPSALPHQPDPAPTHLSVVPLPSPRTLQLQHTRAVRQGASWTAAYHRQLTVAAVARPVHSSVGAHGVVAAERSWWLLAQTTSARSSVQPGLERSGVVAVVDPASRHARRRSPVSSMRCPPIRCRRPGSGCPAVRCPVTWGGRPEVRRSAVCCPPVRCPAVCCLPRLSGRVRILPCSAGGGGDQVEVAGRP